MKNDHSEYIDCFRYGIGHGCDGLCPALYRGECENIADVIEELRKSMDVKELLELYKPYGQRAFLKTVKTSLLKEELDKRLKEVSKKERKGFLIPGAFRNLELE